MPSGTLMEAFRRAHEAHTAATQALVPLLARMVLETMRMSYREWARLEVLGELNEDWLQTLRIQRVLDHGGVVLFEVAARGSIMRRRPASPPLVASRSTIEPSVT